MKKRLIPKIAALAATTLLFCSMLLINTSAHAQCPSGVAPDSIAWSGPDSTHYFISGSCEITVYYCWRTVGDTQQEFITKIAMDSGGCDTANYADIIVIATTSFWCCDPDQPCPPYLPPCDDPYPGPNVVTYIDALCWEHYSPGPGRSVAELVYCYGSAYCERIYHECCDEILGFVSLTLVATQEIPSGYNELCETDPKPPAPWVDNTCYYIDNCTGD